MSKKYKVMYSSGSSRGIIRDGEIVSVDWMLANVGETELYAEAENQTWNPDEACFEDEWATYDVLKSEIINQAVEKGINPDCLEFS